MVEQELMFKVCVDEAVPLALSGRLYSIYEKVSFPFHDFQELILHMDQLLDQAGRPQSSYDKRSFIETKKYSGYSYEPKKAQTFDDIKDIQGVLGTFLIHISSRYHAAWQGYCIFEDQKKYEFHSDLDLLHIFEKIALKYYLKES